MSLVCAQCGAAEFQSSRVRFSDLIWLLQLRLPVRCRNCMKRLHAPIGMARLAQKVARRPRRSARH